MDGSGMNNSLAWLGILDAVRTDHVDPNRSRKAQIEAAGFLVFAPYFTAKLLNCFLEFKCISMN